MKKYFLLLSFICASHFIYSQNNTFPTTGNVGIGTTTPADNLDIVGNLRYSSLLKPAGNAGTDKQVLMNIGGNTNVWTTLQTTHLANFATEIAKYVPLTGAAITGSLSFTDKAGTYPTAQRGFFWDLNNDKTSIITTQPASDQTNFTFQIEDNADANDRFIFRTKEWRGSDYDVYQLYMDGTKAVFNYPDFLGTTGTSKPFDFYIMGNGQTNKNLNNPIFKTVATTNRVGINNGNPQEALDVTGNFKLSGKIKYGNSESRTETRDDVGIIGNSGAQSGFFETATPSSNYPKGATNWWHLLDIRHSNLTNNYAMQLAGSFFDQKIFFRKTNNVSNQAWSELISMDTTGRIKLDNDLSASKKSVILGGYKQGGAIKFSANSTTANNRNLELGSIDNNGVFTSRLVVNAETGNVTIGSVAAQSTYKLAVGGSMIAERVVVKTISAWPDYVFSPSYELPKLFEIEKFVKANHHLPGIPSEKEVQQNGVDVVDLNAKLLQKVEEMTLLMIQMQKQIDSQKQEINKLTQKIER
ncbi:hypothetical protein [Cellulophaga sp. BC115SP]|uniref:hypothetical protein n=1 Tax=Cellulophaga sp. BC115SP TaxID=2683263 RepID=UPI0014133804|nr:hypothetical protein [Cellulophaga sp. BC115SP]NBB31428.1 hypothetical protein [Cellulophaga sp. BC115SP]